jgi:hypothetical protein
MARTVAAMKAGRLAWIARLHKAKALGLIERLPMGPRKAEGRVADGERLINAALRELERLRAAVGRS